MSASGSDVTPKQAEMELTKSIMKRLEDFLDRYERIFRNAMEYQEKPITVVESEEIRNWITDRSEDFEEYRQNMSDVHGDIDALRRMTSGYGDTAQEVKVALKQNVSLLSYFKEKLEEPAPEPKGLDKFEIKLAAWWNSRNVFRWRAGLFFLTIGTTVLVCLYAWNWSDDAWARRAYDAALRVGYENPASLYHQARTVFNTKGRKATKDIIRNYENDMQPITEQGE